jgi:hypothetical protein
MKKVLARCLVATLASSALLTILIAIRDAIFNRANAAITGLMPVEGALVELIQVDDQGVQTGDVLATGTTSITGDYTLTVPAGINLAGNLIVRITGTGGVEMRAQVVEQEVDINPVTEFVLQKFVEEGADLDNLETASVIKLTGQVEEFDLTAGADLTSMIAALEQDTGNFVEGQIAVIDAPAGDGENLVGSYRLVSVGLGLHDDDQQHGVGTFSLDGEIIEFDMADAGDGSVTMTFGAEESFYSNQTGINADYSLTFEAEVEVGEGDQVTARIDDQGVLSLEEPFEEDIDGDFAWRYPPKLVRFQKAKNTNLFVALQSEATVRYLTVDTNSDGTKDAVDPNAREGDEAFKLLDIIAQQPAAMTTADLSGDFGRVYFETEVDSNGGLNVRVEHNKISFDGIGALSITEAQISDLNRNGYEAATDEAATDIPYSISNNGKTFTADGEDQDVVFNDTFDFFVISAVETEDDANPADSAIANLNVGTTFAVKLPNSMPIISSKTYRVFFMGLSVGATSTGIASTRFENRLTVNTDGVSGSITHELLEIEKDNITAEVVATNDDSVTEDATITVGADGGATITVDDEDGGFTLNGYFSEDASLGLFTSSYAETDQDPDELGVVVLVEVDAP